MVNEFDDTAIAQAVQLLDAHPDYKIIRKITPRKSFAENDGRVLSKGVVVDTETTGTDSAKDAIIELGVVARIRERTKLPLPQFALRSHLRTADGVGPSSAHHAV